MSTFADYVANSPAPATQAPGFVQQNITDPIKNAFSGGVNEAVSGYKQATSGGFGDLLSGTGHMITGVGSALASPLAPITKPLIQQPLSSAVGGISDAVSNNPTVQKFAMSPVGKATENVASGINQAANVAGTVGGGMALAEFGGNIWEKAQNMFSGKTGVNAATVAREGAAQTGVDSLNKMTDQVGQFKSDLGTNFKQGATHIEQANPDARLKLTSDQIDALNKLKDNKSFALPEYLKMGSKKGIGYTPNNLNEIHDLYNLTPTQAQDLITQLNKSTFTEKASGMGVDQTKIGLTNEIKDAAHQAFGPQWSKVYSDYSKGVNAVNSINDIVNLNKDATPTDINKSLNSVLKLSGTPEGKIILQNAVNEFKDASGIDLTQGTQAIGQILEKQEALDAASKPGFLKQVVNPTYLAKSAVRYGVIYLGLRAIIKAIQSK